jgi:hypothetical protein
MPDPISPNTSSENLEPPNGHEAVSRSGGVDVNADSVCIDGDVIGRDKIDIAHADIVIINDSQPLTAEKRLAKPLPSYNPKPTLEIPLGAVRPNSPFYVERSADEEFHQQIFGAGTTTTIRASRQTGKTSLLMRGIQTARQEKHPVVYMDFQIIESKHRRALDSLLRHIAEEACYQLKLDPQEVKRIWKLSRATTYKFNEFLEEIVLPQVSCPLLLAIDEADQLLDTAYKDDFFGLVRSWNALSAYNLIWQNLNVALVISTHPYLLIEDVYLSPFNVAKSIELKDFNEDQVSDLNQRHGNPLQTEDIPALMNLLGGHPYLARQALYTLVAQKMTWADLTHVATNDQGPFGKHLRFYKDELAKTPKLVKVLRQVMNQGHSSDEDAIYRLVAAGLVKEEAGAYLCRCKLYEAYFKEKLK